MTTSPSQPWRGGLRECEPGFGAPWRMSLSSRRNYESGSQPSGSVENALRTLQLLRDRRAIQAGEVASELGVARSTAHRLLALLSSYGVVEQEEDGPKYHAGPLLAQLGLSSLRQ